MLALGTATVFEATAAIAIDPTVRPMWIGARMCGPALTVRCAPGDNLPLHLVLEQAAAPGDVLVIDGCGVIVGYWGEILTRAAQARGVVGMVIDGGVRDVDAMESAEFPVFARGISVRGTAKEYAGEIGMPVTLAGSLIEPRSTIIGDRDGVIALPPHDVPAALRSSQQRQATEAEILQRVAAGESTMDIYGLPRPDNSVPERIPTRRQSLHLDGIGHKAPIPAAARVGDLVVSSGISGKDPATGRLGHDTGAQVEFAFSHMETLLQEAGGGLDSLVRVTVFLRDHADKALVDEAWVSAFPNPNDRPSRHTVPLERGGKANVQLEFIASLSEVCP
ncbi:MAG: Rid family hydrolase [Actinomycetota bacterium]|nr:Rid family hydrolase [Actinomycetota bacterium]